MLVFAGQGRALGFQRLLERLGFTSELLLLFPLSLPLPSSPFPSVSLSPLNLSLFLPFKCAFSRRRQWGHPAVPGAARPGQTQPCPVGGCTEHPWFLPEHLCPFPGVSKTSMFHLLTKLFPLLGQDIPASLPGWGSKVVTANSSCKSLCSRLVLLPKEKLSSCLSPSSRTCKKSGSWEPQGEREGSRKSQDTGSCGRQGALRSPKATCHPDTTFPCPQSRAAVCLHSSNPKSPFPNPALGPPPSAAAPRGLVLLCFSQESWGNRSQPQRDAGDSQTYRKLLFQGEKNPTLFGAG